jgi:hypothetical protein
MIVVELELRQGGETFNSLHTSNQTGSENQFLNQVEGDQDKCQKN